MTSMMEPTILIIFGSILSFLIAILIIFLCCKFFYKLNTEEQQRNIANQYALMYNNHNYSSSQLFSSSLSYHGTMPRNATLPQYLLNGDMMPVLHTLDSISVNLQPISRTADDIPPPLPSLSSMPALSSRTTLNQNVGNDAEDDPAYSVIDKSFRGVDNDFSVKPPQDEEVEVSRLERYSSGMNLEDEIMGILNCKKQQSTSNRRCNSGKEENTGELQSSDESPDYKMQNVTADETKINMENMEQILSDPEYAELGPQSKKP
ncbi:uncharacterized protein LOC117116114 [Anneissia japonica]|uniref:uncharacterized protein LOC117116114 n=1 Tax=Anneissia japonica TaxID=1529436 RepID=UPI001425AE5A|nr:uncharacterized protein LOC117116114 [Anneissia japonica]